MPALKMCLVLPLSPAAFLFFWTILPVSFSRSSRSRFQTPSSTSAYSVLTHAPKSQSVSNLAHSQLSGTSNGISSSMQTGSDSRPLVSILFS
ncbi:hypothetical protein [Lancefieldella rimae]|uniref:hypothetical protein n=1 Tax=Lancefieldella rimae TaxID=1383 RepID=UPI003B594AB2